VHAAQNDTWRHLRAGSEMIETGGILTLERFSHTVFGAQGRRRSLQRTAQVSGWNGDGI
jgi:hypothetical protein